jgi:hypothetical protein
MGKTITELWSELSPEDQAESTILTRQLAMEIDVKRLREMREISKKELAEKMRGQRTVLSASMLDDGNYVRAMRAYIKAMGGEITLGAKFPDTELVELPLYDLD